MGARGNGHVSPPPPRDMAVFSVCTMRKSPRAWQAYGENIAAVLGIGRKREGRMKQRRERDGSGPGTCRDGRMARGMAPSPRNFFCAIPGISRCRVEKSGETCRISPCCMTSATRRPPAARQFPKKAFHPRTFPAWGMARRHGLRPGGTPRSVRQNCHVDSRARRGMPSPPSGPPTTRYRHPRGVGGFSRSRAVPRPRARLPEPI